MDVTSGTKTVPGENVSQTESDNLVVLERLAANLFLRVNELERALPSCENADGETGSETQALLLARVSELESQVRSLTHENERLKYRIRHLVRSLEAVLSPRTQVTNTTIASAATPVNGNPAATE